MYRAREQGSANPEFSSLLGTIHKIGSDVVRSVAPEVDRDARFPSEGVSALRELNLLGAYVPVELGGMGLDVEQISRICEVLGQYDGSLAMIFAMHQIQVACLVHHGANLPYFREYLSEMVLKQRLIASATTEIGTGGDLRSSICSIAVEGERFELIKKAPVISYAVEADDILVTCRRSVDAPASDQIVVLARKDDYELEAISGWDTLGFRGTCSSGFVLTVRGSVDQVLPVPFAEILSHTMHPYSHIVWASLWLGIAIDAVNRARRFVRAEVRRSPHTPPIASLRLAEADSLLQGMRNNVGAAATDYCRMLGDGKPEAFNGFGFAIRTNNLKLASSMQVVDIVSRALLICGISGYRNDSEFSLGRHLRDAYGAALMVSNDRIMNHNATMLLTQRES